MRAFQSLSWALALCVFADASVCAQTPAPTSSVPGAAKSDGVSVDTQNGYARILFTFTQPTPVTASVADSVLTIRVGRALNVNIDTLTESVSEYVSTGRRDRDGLTYRFALKKPLALHTSTQANQTVVDLVPDSFKGQPPDLPPPLPAEVKNAPPDIGTLPTIKMRVGEYSDHTRVVFDWPAAVRYSVFPGQGRISIRFESSAKPDFSALQTRNPAWVKSAGWHLDGSATVVDLDTDSESTFKDFRDGPKVVIDVQAPRTDASAILPKAAAPTAPQTTPPPRKGSDAAAAMAAAKAPAATASLRAPIADVASPTAEMTRGGASLHFPAARGHAAAIFTRGETLWIVLDGHPAIDAATLLAPLTSIIVKAQSDQTDGASVLKLVFKAPLLPSVEENEAALNVNLTSGATAPPEPITFTRQGAEGQTTLTTPAAGAVHVLQLSDPDAGDHLFVVPAKPGKGVLTPKRFVEMEALPTAVGIGILPFSDDLSVDVQNQLVTVSRPKGLALSAASGANTEPVVQLLTSKQGPAFIDFAQWAKPDGTDVIAAERNLRAAVARLPESEGNKARLRLARYLLAQNLAPEALGEIQIIQAIDPKLANDPATSAMKGAAQYMMGRYTDARNSLSGSSLGADPHAALWRGMAETKLGDFANARHDLAVSQNVLRFYPAAWQTQARLARAETGLAQGDLASANDALDQLSPQMAPRESVEAKLYEAQLLAAQGHVNESIARLRTLEQTDYAPIAARATYARVDTELGAKKTKPADAIKTLEQLRYRWRGDDLELKTLRKLGSLYFAQQDWRDGLTVLRIAALNFPNSDLARDAQDDMRRAFSDLFLAGKADKMRPVDALALFYDFIELTPIGREGDDMIRRLSDRLVAVDLLGPAEQLLDHQVKERLDGVARASVATRLATIYLIDHKPKEALAVINDTRQTRLPDEVNAERRLLEARALAGLKQYDAAIDLIADDESPQAGHLRAEIAWDSGDWKSAGAKSEELLGDRYNASGPLLPEERALIMRAAVAYSLGGDEAALEQLRAHYTDKMKASPDAKAFAIVSENIDRQGVEFRDLAKQIAQIDTLTAFMADFKKQGAAAAKTASN